LETEQSKEISFRYLRRDFNQNASNNKFRFEAFQLPFDSSIIGESAQKVLELYRKVEKGKVIYQTARLMVYLNFSNTGFNSSVINNKNSVYGNRDDMNSRSNAKMQM